MIPIVIIEITSIMPSSGHGEMSILQFEHAYQFIWDNDSNEVVAIFFLHRKCFRMPSRNIFDVACSHIWSALHEVWEGHVLNTIGIDDQSKL